MISYQNNRGKTVGYYQDGIYKSVRDGRRHILKMMDAWGLDKKILDALEDPKEIQIFDKPAKKIYKIPIDEFLAHSVVKNFDGEQVFVSRKHWKVEDK